MIENNNDIKVLDPKCAERLFFDNGKIAGDIRTFNSESKILSKPLLTNKEFYENTSEAVGRIFVRFIINNEAKWSRGTGFCVKRDTIITARHVLLLSLDPNPPDINRYDKIYIYFGCNASVDQEITLSNCADSIATAKPGFYELESLGREFDSIFKEKLFVKKIDNHSQLCSWPTENDIEVFKFKDKTYFHDHFILPMIPSIINNNSNQTINTHYVMGYPDAIELSDYTSEYPEEINGKEPMDIIIQYAQILNQFKIFEHKTMCISNKLLCLERNVLLHHCPTLRGTSGGILAEFDQKKKFIGIHLGGSQEIGNIAISVTHPLFCHIYQEYVLVDKDFENINRDSLKPYIDYIKKTLSQYNVK
ncbi:hypothetical protein PPL_06835 [Heterostelium album PN500]|uniref:Serine protease n=1 Tax=Heterostelium pallidum (strain ATCC 26659 / Pp 5 / PN500) TaxID=670386 RepID=D3BDN3_HETP5|nr:hypothetical protein PPL_06835 [Heterostelium album PN500]EFA80014.1 hypothetical protein PPL_06835 [Heterostelium album PN500]|eukprot:XP_020432134.1 hypothetical protein PPL_06835 [Heterostelium album PN500]